MKNFFLIFIVLFLINIFFYLYFIGDFSVDGYLDAEHAWSDQKYYIDVSRLDEFTPAFLEGVTFYAVLMYKAFPTSMIWSLLINSLIYSLAISILILEKKKYAFAYFFFSLPLLCYFSIGFTKEAPIILGLVILNHAILKNSRAYFIMSWLLLVIVKPTYAMLTLPLQFAYVRENAKRVLLCALIFTPVYFGIVVALFSDNFFVERYSNFENGLRSTYPLISVIGNIIAMAKVYLEAFFIDPLEKINNIQSDILIYFSSISTIILTLNSARFLQHRSYLFLLVFLFLSMGPIAHYRYVMPLIFVWAYVVLPRRKLPLTENQCNQPYLLR